MRSASLSLVLAFPLLAAPAAAQIHQPGTQPMGAPMDALQVGIQSSGGCARCHARYDDADDYEPYESWRGSLMGNAMRDPVVRAALAIAEEDHPEAADFCVRCHSPAAWLRGRSELPEFGTEPRLTPDDGEGLSDDLNGVTCMTCHRMTDPVDAANLQNARLFIADGVDGTARRGPYTYEPGLEPMHLTAVEPFLSDERFCGSCHDISNPIVPGQRVEGGALVATGRDFAIERTYSEWAASAFAREDRETCQSCHMPVVDRPVLAGNDGPSRSEMNRHDLVGGSVWVPLAIAAAIEDLDAEQAAALRASSERARRMLESAARVEITASDLSGDVATASVTVTNLTGHKLPTGYPEGRRMWLEVIVEDATGAVVASSGRFDPATSTLQEDDQLHTWEVHLGQGTTPSFHFILNDVTLDDTRIPPEGFMPPAEADMLPVGRDYADGAGGYRHWDEASYTLPVCGTGELTLRARLLYQSTVREYIEFLRDEAPASADPALGGESYGDVAYRAWQEHGGMEAVLMEEASVTLGMATMPCPEPLPDAGTEAMDAGTSGGADAGPPASGGGCTCRASGGRREGGSIPLAVLVGYAVLRRRRRG